MNSEARARAGRIAGGAALFLLGVAVSLYYGRRGFMPLDQSIVFDGGWRVLSGQIPLRDYYAPNGLVAHAMQAIFFGLLGVSWLSYCLHAAVINGLFVLLVQRILDGLGLAPSLSFVYASLSALVLVPPLGVPYMDQHAFFFSLLALWMALAARRAEGSGPKRWPWLLLPTVLLLAGFSKQIPSAYMPPIVLAVALWDERAARTRRLALLALGSAIIVAILGIASFALEVDWARADIYFRRLPSEEGARRVSEVAGLASLLARIGSDAAAVGLVSIGVVHATFAAAAATLVAGFVARRASLEAPVRAVFMPALLGESLLAVCLLFTAMTLNQPALGVPFVFLAAGLAHLSFERAATALQGRPWPARALRILAVVILVIALRDGLHFTAQVNATRSVNDIVWEPGAAARAAPDVHPSLSFMAWQLSSYVPYQARDLTRAAEYLAAQDENFLLIGDASVLYGITGKPSVPPSLWFHPGLTVPLPGDEAFPDYEAMLLERLDALDVRFVVVEGRHTWNHMSLDSFPQLAQRVRGRSGEIERFGGIAVVDLTGP